MNLSRRVKTYLGISRVFASLPGLLAKLARPLESLAQAVWLGLLDARQLNQVTWASYNRNSGFDSPAFNMEQGLWPWEREAIQRHFAGRNNILVAGAGGGREVIALARLGYEVTGFDFSPPLVSAARRHIEQTGCKARMLAAPPSAVPELSAVYDALLIGRGFYHHMPGKANRVAFLAACNKALKPEAAVILADFHTRPADAKGPRRTWSIAKFIRRLSNNKEPVELGDALGCDFHHLFTREEIADEFAAAGFRLEEFIATSFGDDSRLAHVLGTSQATTGTDSTARQPPSHADGGTH